MDHIALVALSFLATVLFGVYRLHKDAEPVRRAVRSREDTFCTAAHPKPPRRWS